MARKKGEAYRVGSLVGFKLTREDLVDIIPFLNERKACGDEISGLLRGIVREHVLKHTNPASPHVDPDQLAEWVGQLIRRAMAGEKEFHPLPQVEVRFVAKVATETDAHVDAVSMVNAKLGSKFVDDDD